MLDEINRYNKKNKILIIFSPRVGIPCVSALIIIIRAKYPNLRFDNISLWIFFIAILVWAVPDIGGLINRIKRFKKGDLEIEFEKQIDELAQKLEKIEEKDIITEKEDKTKKETQDYFYLLEDIKTLLTAPAANPRGILVSLAVEIEEVLRRIAEYYDIPEARKISSPHKLMQIMVKRQIISEEIFSLFRDFWMIRNQAVHSAKFKISEEELYRLIDLGVRILRLLNSNIPSLKTFKKQENSNNSLQRTGDTAGR